MTEDFITSIYVVDDNEVNRRLLELILTAAGYANTRLIPDGVSALKAIEARPPDIVLLDLHMPRLDGFGVLRRFSSTIAPDDFLPVLVLTADVDRDARTRALMSGATDFLTKPFDAEEVVTRRAGEVDQAAASPRGVRLACLGTPRPGHQRASAGRHASGRTQLDHRGGGVQRR